MLTNTFKLFGIREPIHTACLTVSIFFLFSRCFIFLSRLHLHLIYVCYSEFNVRSHFFTNTNSKGDSTNRRIATQLTHTHKRTQKQTYTLALCLSNETNKKQKNTAKSIFEPKKKKTTTANIVKLFASFVVVVVVRFNSKSKIPQ